MAETRDIPAYPLTDDVQPEIAELGLYVGRFKVPNTQMDRPPGMHRHGHFELYWLHGPAEDFNDYGHFRLPAERPSFILISPGQLHRWEGADHIRGTLISFTTAFMPFRRAGRASGRSCRKAGHEPVSNTRSPLCNPVPPASPHPIFL